MQHLLHSFAQGLYFSCALRPALPVGLSLSACPAPRGETLNEAVEAAGWAVEAFKLALGGPLLEQARLAARSFEGFAGLAARLPVTLPRPRPRPNALEID